VRVNLDKVILDPDELEKLGEKFTHAAWNTFFVELVGSDEKESHVFSLCRFFLVV